MNGMHARIARWRPPLRMARRDLRSHPLRTLVLIFLVALPISVAVVAATVTSTQDYYSENSVSLEFGAADAKLSVTRWPEVRSTLRDEGRYVEWRKVRGLTSADQRDAEAVDPVSLLPEGSRVTRVGEVPLALASGGTVYADVLDLSDPLTRGLGRVESGRAPRAADEVAVSREVAAELGLLDAADGLVEGATLDVADGGLRVVGLVLPQDSYTPVTVVVPPSTTLRAAEDPWTTYDYLVDLPELSTEQSIALDRDLAGEGVSTWWRDATADPRAWGLDEPLPEPVDPAAAVTGALIIGLGSVEVLVLVGATFAVGARRQARSLGLVMATGGTPSDLRRIVLSQGVLIGAVAAAVGAGGGVLVLALGRGLVERWADTPVYDYSTSVGTVVVVTILGALSAVAAAAVPAWGGGRMTATEALDGHVGGVRTSTGRPRVSRLRAPALGATTVGLVGLLLCGAWIARAYAGSPTFVSVVPVVLGGGFALLLLTGVVLGVPSLVEALGRLLSRGWLPWRLSTRDATRHRARTSAAVLAIGIVTTGAVCAGFGVSAANAYASSGLDDNRFLPDGVVEIYDDVDGVDGADAPAARTATIRRVLGADRVSTAGTVRAEGRPVVARGGVEVFVVDRAWLEMAGAPLPARDAFAQGSAVVADADPGGRIRDGQVTLRTPGRRGGEVAVLPAAGFSPDWSAAAVYVPRSSLAEDGLSVREGERTWAEAPDVTQADVDRLSLYGITAEAQLPTEQVAASLVYAGAAGTLLLTALVVGMVVALASAEGRDDAATLAAVGAPPRIRRAMSAGHAVFVGGLGSLVGLFLGAAVGVSLLQVVGTSGTPVPWGALAVLALGVPLLCAVTGWCVAPGRLALTRRAG